MLKTYLIIVVTCILFLSACKTTVITDGSSGMKQNLAHSSQSEKPILNYTSEFKQPVEPSIIQQISHSELVYNTIEKSRNIGKAYKIIDTSLIPQKQRFSKGESTSKSTNETASGLASILEKIGLTAILMGIGFPLLGWYVAESNQLLLGLFHTIGLILLVFGGLILTIRGFLK